MIVEQYEGVFERLRLSEEDRQLVLLALAVLSLRSPGMYEALRVIAMRIDDVRVDERGITSVTFEEFRTARRSAESREASR